MERARGTHRLEQADSSGRYNKIMLGCTIVNLGCLALYAASAYISYVHGPEKAQQLPPANEILDKYAPCEDETLQIKSSNGRQLLITDSRKRCDYTDKFTTRVRVFEEPANRNYTPLAVLESGIYVEGLCFMPDETSGQDWIKISTAIDEDGTKVAAGIEGYVSEYKVVGESSLPLCDDVTSKSVSI